MRCCRDYRTRSVGCLKWRKRAQCAPSKPLQKENRTEGLFTASQDYFIVYHSNAALVMQIADANLRRSIIQTYTRAKAVLDTVNMNRLYLERYHYLQSTFLKTKDTSVQAESEDYRGALVQIAGQLKQADVQFRRTAAGLLEMLSCTLGTEPKERGDDCARKSAAASLGNKTQKNISRRELTVTATR